MTNSSVIAGHLQLYIVRRMQHHFRDHHDRAKPAGNKKSMVLCTPSGMYLTSVTVLATLGTTIAGWIIRCTAVTTAPMVNMVASYLTTQ
jgi:hypothetical protein